MMDSAPHLAEKLLECNMITENAYDSSGLGRMCREFRKAGSSLRAAIEKKQGYKIHNKTSN
jgi:hypothetical protein